MNDSHRLLLEWFDAIHNSPSQVYHLALPFCPPSSFLRTWYTTELSQEVKVIKGLPAEWGMCSRTVELGDEPKILVCWKDTVAVGSHSWEVIIFNGITGSQTGILSGHTRDVMSLAFSSDGASLASGSMDRTIKLWDMQTGGVVKTFHGHTSWVVSISISTDYTMIASGSLDKTIRLWNIQTEECHNVIEQQNNVTCVKFSPIHPQCLTFVSGGEVWKWDINGHQIDHVHNGSHIAFSPDDTQLVLCQGKDIVIQNSESGAIVVRFHVANNSASHCCFSPDSRFIAVAVGPTAYVWDTTGSDSHPIKTFIGHSGDITSLAFLSYTSLISSSQDKSVKFWQIGTPSPDQVMADPEPTPQAPSFINQLLKFWTIGSPSTDLPVASSESTLLASAPVKSITLQSKEGIAISSHSDGVVRTWDVLTGHCKASFQTPAEGDYCDAQLVNSGLVSVWHKYRKIHIWDLEKSELIHTVDATGHNISSIRISGDGSKVFCLFQGFIQAWSIPTGEVVGEVELRFAGPDKSLTVDGSKVWFHSSTLSEPLGWDFGIIGSSPVKLSGIPLPQPNDTKWWDISQSRIKDTVSGKVVFQLAGRFATPADSQWDGQYLVAGYRSGEVLVLDFNCVPFE